jgi:hypothetical protein
VGGEVGKEVGGAVPAGEVVGLAVGKGDVIIESAASDIKEQTE